MTQQKLGQLILDIAGKLYEKDKQLHFVWSFWLTMAARIVWPVQWAFVVVLLIGLSKEFWDMRFGSGFCVFDLVANLLGSVAALALTYVLPGPVFEA